jgi:putative two-component system response regulator
MRVLIVDDDDIALELLSSTLEDAGYSVEVARDGVEALEMLRSGRFQLVISDWEMPRMNGVELCRAIRKREYFGYIYFILVTAREVADDVVQGLNAGADDFISKPFDPGELCVRLRAGERILALEGRDVTIFALAKLAESRDPETGSHLERIRDYCKVLAEHLATVSPYNDVIDGDYVRTIYQTSPLHDIGKVGIPDNVLLKPGKLTYEEFEIMKTHVIIGAETLEAAAKLRSGMDFLRMARDLVLTHHERFDGTGYPNGLVGEEIPLSGRILALADVYDAITTKRVYKEASTHEVARSIIVQASGSHFDPDIVDTFLATEQKFIEIQKMFSESDSFFDPSRYAQTELVS